MASSMETSSAGRSLRCHFAGFDFDPSHIFSHQQAPNTLSPRFGLHAISANLLPSGTKYFIPVGIAVRADWVSPGWFSIYELFFRIGFRLPCSGLAQELLKDLGVMPCQLMTAVWKALYAIEAVGREHGCLLTLADLKYNYSLRSYGSGRVTLRIRDQREHLILNMDSGDDKHWYSAFFFVKKDTLGEDCSFIATELKSRVEDWEMDPDSTGCSERIANFLAVPEVQRTWPLASVPVAASFQQEVKSEKVTPSKSGVSSRTRTTIKLDEVVAHAKARGVGLRVPRKVGRPTEAVVPQSSSLKSPIVVDDSEPIMKLDKVVEEALAVKRTEGCSVEAVKKRRKVIVGDHSSFVVSGDASLEEGEQLLKSHASPGEADLHVMAAKLASSVSQSLQYALTVGGGYRRVETQLRLTQAERDRFAADLKVLQEKMDDHKKNSAALKASLEETKSELATMQSGALERIMHVERLADTLQRREAEIADLKLHNQNLSAEMEDLKRSQQEDAVYYNMTGRIELLKEPSTEWDLQSEILKFKTVFPDDVSFDEFLQSDSSADPEEKQAERAGGDRVEAEASKAIIKYEGKSSFK